MKCHRCGKEIGVLAKLKVLFGKKVIELHDTFLQPCFSCFKDSLKTSA
jgi:hypothetical protein